MAHLNSGPSSRGGFVSDFLHISWTSFFFCFSKYIFIDFKERKEEGERVEASMMRNIDHCLLHIPY